MTKQSYHPSLKAIKALHEATGHGLVECKQALEACLGHADLATVWLRRRGEAVAYQRPEMRPERRMEATARERGPVRQ